MVKSVGVRFTDQSNERFECAQIKYKDSLIFLMGEADKIETIIPIANVQFVVVDDEIL